MKLRLRKFFPKYWLAKLFGLYIYDFPVITAPEGLDLWNPADKNASQALKKVEALVKGISADEIDGLILPHGWKFDLHHRCLQVELLEE
jgi:hypothetical protein